MIINHVLGITCSLNHSMHTLLYSTVYINHLDLCRTIIIMGEYLIYEGRGIELMLPYGAGGSNFTLVRQNFMGQSYLYIKCKHHKCEGRTMHCCVKQNQHTSMLLLGSLGPRLPGKF